jgi:hypothetical protein
MTVEGRKLTCAEWQRITSSRPVVRHYAGLSRRAVQRHRDVCLRLGEEAA